MEAEDDGLAKTHFLEYLAQHGKSYTTGDEMARRAAIFIENDRVIREWNAMGMGTELAHNKFSDWESHEYENLLNKKRRGSA